MRAISAAQQGVLDAGVQAEYCRVSIKDSGGTFRDLTTYPGFNALKAVTWAEQIDDPHMTCHVTLMREAYKLSLSPFMGASALNRGFDALASFAPLLALARELKVEVAICPMDKPPSSGDWFEVFRGRVDTLDAAKGKDVELEARGLAGRLAQQFIKTELVYSYAEVSGIAVPLRIWEPQIAVTASSPLVYLLPASRGDDDPGLNKFLKCSQSGTTGTTEPVWTTGTNQTDGSAKWDYVGAPTTSGNPVEEIIQNILDDNRLTGDAAVTLYTPSSPGWAIRQFIQQRQFTLDAVRALATQIGWDLRYKWKTASSSFELTLYTPNRSSPTVNFTFGPSDYLEPDKLAIDIAQIRNAWRVIYMDRADLWPDGTPKRKVIEVSDSGSITKYGELWAEIIEDEASNVDTSTEATSLANAALSDCKEPTAELEIPLARGFPWVELNDYYTFSANSLHFDSNQSLAVTGWNQTFAADENGKAKLVTRLELRGLPTIGAQVHLDKTSHPSKLTKQKIAGGAHQLVQFQGTKTPALTFEDVVGGTRVKLDVSTVDKHKLLQEYEIHVSPDTGFTPDDTTLAAVTKSDELVLSQLLPGEPYFALVVPRFMNAGKLIRGQPSTEVSFTAGRASAGHVHEGIAVGDYPLNGGFETRLAAMPDHWKIIAGTYNTHFIVKEDANGLSGGRYLRLVSRSAVDTEAISAQFPIINESAEANRYSQLYRVSCWVKNDSGNSGSGTKELFYLTFYDYAGAQVATSGAITYDSESKLGHWQKIETFISLSGSGDQPDIRSMVISIITNAGSPTYTFDVDELRIQHIGTPWYEIGDTTKFTENYESIPGFQGLSGGWSNFGSGNEVCAIRKNQFGRVFIKGLATTDTHTLGTTNKIFTLPAGWRPPASITKATSGNGKYAELSINTSGLVWIGAADSATFGDYTSICIDFETF